MLYYEILLIAIGLSMDSLAVSVTTGALMRHCSSWNLMRIASILALFQAGMTVAGYMAGMGFEQYIQAYDHWIAFFLLLYLGGKMVYSDLRSQAEEDDDRMKDDCTGKSLSNKTLCGMGLATSIDALAVGISLAILDAPLLSLAVIIGIVTFLFAAMGVYLGCRVGRRLDVRLELIGGLILIAIGTKILIEHLCF